jgi:hypothetical protein
MHKGERNLYEKSPKSPAAVPLRRADSPSLFKSRPGLFPPRALLGDGIPLLPSLATRPELKLMNHRVYTKTGIISLEYSVQHGP